jgi:hypothetical protein
MRDAVLLSQLGFDQLIHIVCYAPHLLKAPFNSLICMRFVSTGNHCGSYIPGEVAV